MFQLENSRLTLQAVFVDQYLSSRLLMVIVRLIVGKPFYFGKIKKILSNVLE